ncbi:DNA-binding protein HGH1, partial [Diplocarpon rosae]
MPTELEELVEFVSHGNTQVRQLAVENLVPYSATQPAIFKTNELLPVKDLKLLVRDYEVRSSREVMKARPNTLQKIARDATTILINLTADQDILEYLASDHEFVKILLGRVTNPSEPNANLISMLLANLAKYDELKDILAIERPAPQELASNNKAIDQLLDLFVKGADGTYNKAADFDYLSYLFADLAKHKEGRQYFLAKQEYDGVVPLTKLVVFTEHKSFIRRKGVASTIKNVAFEVDAHPAFLAEDEINILPYLLLPITGSEDFTEEESVGMLPDLQLLPPDKRRDPDPSIIQTHIETLMLLTTTRQGRDLMRQIKLYPIVRETHLHVEDDGVREACERLVQVLMREEEDGEVGEGMMALEKIPRTGTSSKPFGKPQISAGAGSWAQQDESQDDDDDDKVVE